MSSITWHHPSVNTDERAKRHGHQPLVLWYTGLSGSGKSTLANALDRRLFEEGRHTYVLDGDNVRHGLCRDLGFDDAARSENIRRVTEVAKLFIDAGVLVSTAFISPFAEDRQQARELIGNDNFVEIFVDTPWEECAKRDPKGLYKQAMLGKITDFTGQGSGYEPPSAPDVHIRTIEQSIDESVQTIYQVIAAKLKLCDGK